MAPPFFSFPVLRHILKIGGSTEIRLFTGLRVVCEQICRFVPHLSHFGLSETSPDCYIQA
jgi:hypothetical protein